MQKNIQSLVSQNNRWIVFVFMEQYHVLTSDDQLLASF